MTIDYHLADRPKLLGDLSAKSARIAELCEPHIAPLTDFVEELRREAGEGVAIPNFDPWDAGIEAEILFLLEAPGAKAVGSSFISRNNPDETAKNMFELNRQAGIPRKRSLLWNAVPWYIGDGARIRAANAKDLEDGLVPLPRLIQLLPKLRAVVFMGRKAETARAQVALLRPDLALFTTPHPSPLFVNRFPGNREVLLKAFQEVARFLEGPASADQGARQALTTS